MCVKIKKQTALGESHTHAHPTHKHPRPVNVQDDMPSLDLQRERGGGVSLARGTSEGLTDFSRGGSGEGERSGAWKEGAGVGGG